MCDDESQVIIKDISSKCCQNDEFCSDKIITKTYIWQYRSPKGGRAPDTLLNVGMCKRHNEWLMLANGNKKREFIQGRDITEATGDDLCSVFSNYDYANKASFIYTFWVKSEYPNDVILINEGYPKFDSVMISKGFEKKGMFHYNGKHIVDLTPISWEITYFQRQRQPCNQRADYKGDKKSSIYRPVLNNDDNDDNDDKKDKKMNYYGLKCFDIEPKSVLDIWIEERSNFEECLDFINSNMNLNLPALCDKYETEFLFKYSNMLENALFNKKPDSSLDLLTLLDDDNLSLEVLWIVYVKYNHRLHAPEFNYGIDEDEDENMKYSLSTNDMLINLFIKLCSADELKYLLMVAIEGPREKITYKQKDFYDYIRTNLYVVKRLVPKYIHNEENILIQKAEDENDDNIEKVKDIKKTMTPLEFWHSTTNYTWSTNGFEESKYEYDKDETIREYLESLSI